MPTSNFQPIMLLDSDCCFKFAYLMANRADPDQLASSGANWSGSTLFAKQGISGFSRTRVKSTYLCNVSLQLIELFRNYSVWMALSEYIKVTNYQICHKAPFGRLQPNFISPQKNNKKKTCQLLSPYHTTCSSKIWTSPIYYPMLCLKIAGWVANSVDPDEMLHYALFA